jgi:hypothetical protein
VFSIALSLALAASSLPTASVASNAAIAVCFSPEEDSAAFSVRAIDNAESEILVGAYDLTTGSSGGARAGEPDCPLRTRQARLDASRWCESGPWG